MDAVVTAPSEDQLGEAKVVARWGEPTRDKSISTLGVSGLDEASGSYYVAVGRHSGRFDVLDGRAGDTVFSVRTPAGQHG